MGPEGWTMAGVRQGPTSLDRELQQLHSLGLDTATPTAAGVRRSRPRATLSKLVELPGLTEKRRRAAILVVLRNTHLPHEFNVRSESCRSLCAAGVAEAKAPCMALTLLSDAPYWVAANAVTGLHALARRQGTGPDDVISILAASLALYPVREREVKLLQPENYYHWGVMYRVHPPFAVLTGLRAATGEDFGLDLERWRAWQRQTSRSERPTTIR
jgi:hypothetical protein